MSSENKEYPKVEADPGVLRQVLADHPSLMVVAFSFDTDAVGTLHQHPHVQSTYVLSGLFDFTVGGQTQRLSAGDSLVIPGNTEHGCVALESGTLIDTFTPRRDDFL